MHHVKLSNDNIIGHNHHIVMVSVVGAGITLPFDVEPCQPGESEYTAGKRLLKRAVSHLGPRHFTEYRNHADSSSSFLPFSATPNARLSETAVAPD